MDAFLDMNCMEITEIGHNQVQGIDYAYTLQGWLKGTNSSNLSTEAEMGGDSRGTSVNKYFAQDAASFSLHYFQGDYLHIGGNTSFLASDYGSYISGIRKNLWNGNISSMWTNIADPGISQQNDQWGMLGMAYRYDQLNRLVSANGYNGAAFDAVAGAWSQTETPAKYHNSFTYDANGNILTQLRADQSNTNLRNAAYEQSPDFANNPHYYVDPNSYIDNIAYTYERNADNEIVANRLYHVNDAVNHTTEALTDDINYTNNYGYTAIGELERDNNEDIEKIEWRVDSKIAYIYRVDDSDKDELAFD
jgi:hypothetical protein